MSEIYLNRYAWPGSQLNTPPKRDIKIIVVIPCYHEPEIINALNSLEQCDPPECEVEIITVINHSEDELESTRQFNKDTAKLLDGWANDNHQFTYHTIKAYDLPRKKAGVGLARKIGMDEAVRRFDMLNEENGIIVCYDADCTCSKNYLSEIERTYHKNPETNVALVYFEHDTSSNVNKRINKAIIDYELHLRYYVQALKYAKFPFAHHTVGSCITVPSSIYQKQGGMNTKKAGEDFYFLQRIFPLGNIRSINSAAVYPSPRPSDRVPFGTGRAVSEIIKREIDEYFTYNPKIFQDFRKFNEAVHKLWDYDSIDDFLESVPDSITEYLSSIDFTDQIQKLKRNFKTHAQFINAFYNWFNGFKALKYIHFARDKYYPNEAILIATKWILQELLEIEANDKAHALNLMRQLERSEQ